MPGRSAVWISAKAASLSQIEMLLPFEGLNIKPATGEFGDPRFIEDGLVQENSISALAPFL